MRPVARFQTAAREVIEALKPGPRVVLVNFAEDSYDVGGRMAEVARRCGAEARGPGGGSRGRTLAGTFRVAVSLSEVGRLQVREGDRWELDWR